MTAARRILVHHRAGREGDAALRRTKALVRTGDEVCVVHVLDTRSAFDGDGPAGQLAGERASRSVAACKAQLDRALRQHGLVLAEAVVRPGVAAHVLPALVDKWRADVVLCDERMARAIARDSSGGAELVAVRASVLDRLALWRTPLAADAA